MPVMGGNETCRIMKKNRDDEIAFKEPIYALTAYSDIDPVILKKNGFNG